MEKQGSQLALSSPTQARANPAHAIAAADVWHIASCLTTPIVSKARRIQKAGEVNISVYVPAEVKSSLRMVQAKTGYKLRDCPAEAVRDSYTKHNAPIFLTLVEGQ